ncbi:Stp1/IreP family PP2C-type Ser/Thr phosphatase [Kouleothrix sp.]|uniref:Stp1/IreP family PP2C-type Ser/Thr phosphatase n=1 Tax=Kouleothrix sp. TaxID=2779161 RepID=UPI00391AE59A
MKLRHSARTDVGKTRDHNEDNFGVGGDERAAQLGELLVVCDGMGGHAAGEVASQIGVETILANYYGDSSDDRQSALEQAFEQANSSIFARGQGSMGTTGVAALLHHDALHIANVGDSRAYLVRDGEIRQVSRDHSFVSDQVAAGLITADQARFSPHRNVITRALGYQPDVTVDLFRLPLQVGDIVVLSSDGLHGLVTDAEILQIAGEQPPEQATQALIDLANSRGGTDNITVMIARVDGLEWYGEGAPAPDDLHDRTTIELPATERLAARAEAPTERLEPQPAPAAAPPAASARPTRPPEPGLNWRGLVLALALLSVLIGIILFYAPSVLAPGGAESTPTAAPSAPAATAAPPTLPPAPSVAPTSNAAITPTAR